MLEEGVMAKQIAGKAKRTSKPKAKMQTVGKTKWNTKDSVFTHLFSFPEYQLELYKTLHPDDQDVSEADIKTITRDCVVTTHEHNDLGILIKDRFDGLCRSAKFVVAKHCDPAHVLCRAEPDGLFP